MTETKENIQEEPIDNGRHAWLAYSAIWIIILTCVVTDIFFLRRTVLLYTTIPIIIFVLTSMGFTYLLRKKTDG